MKYKGSMLLALTLASSLAFGDIIVGGKPGSGRKPEPGQSHKIKINIHEEDHDYPDGLHNESELSVSVRCFRHHQYSQTYWGIWSKTFRCHSTKLKLSCYGEITRKDIDELYLNMRKGKDIRDKRSCRATVAIDNGDWDRPEDEIYYISAEDYKSQGGDVGNFPFSWGKSSKQEINLWIDRDNPDNEEYFEEY
ncbi:hypothetical protein ACWJJH_12085 [Endozoicomonadaceae bacterium StTr2]